MSTQTANFKTSIQNSTNPEELLCLNSISHLFFIESKNIHDLAYLKFKTIISPKAKVMWL